MSKDFAYQSTRVRRRVESPIQVAACFVVGGVHTAEPFLAVKRRAHGGAGPSFGKRALPRVHDGELGCGRSGAG
jgi:hypothetical protein